MNIEDVKSKHQEGLAQLAVKLSQKETLEQQIKDLRSQLLQLEAVMQYDAASSRQESTAPVADSGPEGE